MTAPARGRAQGPAAGDGAAPGRVLVLNPNSSARVTASLAESASGWTRPGVLFEVAQLDAAPAAITSPADHRLVAPLVVEALVHAGDRFDAVVVACHGDPGVDEARRQTDVPVIGIGAASFHAAATTARRFAVAALSSGLLASKARQVEESGTQSHCVGIWPVDTEVEDGLRDEADLGPYLAVARKALDAGAEALVLGCAGMGPLATRLAARIGIPVLDPTAVAATLAGQVAAQRAAAVPSPATPAERTP